MSSTMISGNCTASAAARAGPARAKSSGSLMRPRAPPQLRGDAGRTGHRSARPSSRAQPAKVRAVQTLDVFTEAPPDGLQSVMFPTLLQTDLRSVSDPPSCQLKPKKTHIICTLGPSSRTVSQLVDLLNCGMSVARFNFSHGSHEYHYETLMNLREACSITGKICATLLDTKGPEIRTGMLKDGKAINLEQGNFITLTPDYTFMGDASKVALSYPHLARDMIPGNLILMSDGAVMLEVVSSDKVLCRCLNSCKLGERKNCNLPGVSVDLPTLTDKDMDDLINFGVKYSMDFIAASFVRKASDVWEIRRVLEAAAKANPAPPPSADNEWGYVTPTAIKIIAKVENQEGLTNFDQILEAADGIMVARGDLGMEIPLEKMFWVQKSMIHKCNLKGKPVITATQMLDSMITNPRPTRAEATDVGNAVLDGTDCVMLSGETAAGTYPRQAVEIMGRICEEAEKAVDNFALCQGLLNATLTRHPGPLTTIEALASSAVLTAAKVKAACIVVLAANGNAARLIAKYRPDQPVVVGVVPRTRREKIGFQERDVNAPAIARQCLLTRGLIPVVVSTKDSNLDAAAAAKEAVMETIDHARARGLVSPGELIVTMYNVERQCAVIRIVECPTEPIDQVVAQQYHHQVMKRSEVCIE